MVPTMRTEAPAFDLLSPDLILDAVESAFDVFLTSVVTPYSSYINRVYGLETDDGERFVVKFYRPDRWTTNAILEEHRFITDCVEAELPVVSPITNAAGSTLQCAVAMDDEGITDEGARFFFALFPHRGGRQFDAERDEDWIRLGSVVARLHQVGKMRTAPSRRIFTPAETTSRQLEELRTGGVVHPDVAPEFFGIVDSVLERISPGFDGLDAQRIHGDCHRGNILDRPGEGLMLIDFDDMLTGPVVQDIWLLLPDYAESAYRELELIMEGYEQFARFDRATLRLVEPLRFMRMIHYLAWASRQRFDGRFRESFPDWGGKAFWIKEVEDLQVQERVISGTG